MIIFIALLILSLAHRGQSFTDNEKFFQIKSATSEEFSEYCIQLNQTSGSISINSCEAGNGSQLWNVDSHSRIHNEVPGQRAGCIFNVNNTLSYDRDCSNPSHGLNKQYAKFSFNLFDDKIMNGYKAFQIVGDVQNGTPVKMRKPKSMKINQKWKLVFVPLPEQIKLVDRPCSETGDCPVCSGDCHSDSECKNELRCARRELFNNRETVPGCFWGEDSGTERFLNRNYCFDPTDVSTQSTINYVGECSSYSNGYKCKKCEGGCHWDSDCQEGLHCKSRLGFEAVPGCQGESGALDMYGKGICFDPHPPSVSPGSANCTMDNDCALCRTCVDDEDCFGDLRCANRTANATVPGCSISADSNPSIFSETNICFRPLTFPGSGALVNYIGECSNVTYQCNRCEAGCSSDEDCSGELTCLQRTSYEHVPGCFHEGGELDMEGKNVCYDSSSKPELIWWNDHCSNCPECGGRCRRDGDCRGHLRCAKRDGLEDVPGCRWGSNTTNGEFLGKWKSNYCFDPPVDATSDEVRYVGECSPHIPGYLCGECEGNCKLDSDCKFDLKCLYRSSFENVPGCRNEGGDKDMFGKGVCYDPGKFPSV